MKTAMQELIEYLDPIHSGIKDKAIQLLEKEKEQIIEAYCDGFWKGSQGNRILSEEYYNETYNDGLISK